MTSRLQGRIESISSNQKQRMFYTSLVLHRISEHRPYWGNGGLFSTLTRLKRSKWFKHRLTGPQECAAVVVAQQEEARVLECILSVSVSVSGKKTPKTGDLVVFCTSTRVEHCQNWASLAWHLGCGIIGIILEEWYTGIAVNKPTRR